MTRARTLTPSRRSRFVVGLIALAVACGSPTHAQRSVPTPAPPGDSAPALPALGDSATLEAASWNVEWFGSADFDPADDALQAERVRAVIAAADVDLWGLQEVVDAAAWRALLAGLPGYGGVLATDPEVDDGSSYYYAKEQKPALLYRTDAARVLDARLVLTEHDHAFAGRPPLQVELVVSAGGVSERIVVLVVHMKAGADAEARDRREGAAAALKDFLDRHHADRRVLVLGDFNDDVDVSIHPGSPTPYAAFVADTARWTFPTAALSEAGFASMTRYPDVVDHHLASDEMMRSYVVGSARVVRLDRWLDRYDDTTSDHFPVLTRWSPAR